MLAASQDPFGNYVVQYILEKLNDPTILTRLVAKLQVIRIPS